MFYVYILKSAEDRKLYIGSTNDLRKRLREHIKNKSFSTRSRGKLELVYYEAYRDERGARQREKMIKHFGSAYSKLKRRLRFSLQ
ncbi:MAG: GIY-YIG nuclease family protein [Patescibacteria group bacterium]